MAAPYRTPTVTPSPEDDPSIGRFAATLRGSRRRTGLQGFVAVLALAALAAAPLLGRAPPVLGVVTAREAPRGFFEPQRTARTYPITVEVQLPWWVCFSCESSDY